MDITSLVLSQNNGSNVLRPSAWGQGKHALYKFNFKALSVSKASYFLLFLKSWLFLESPQRWRLAAPWAAQQKRATHPVLTVFLALCRWWSTVVSILACILKNSSPTCPMGYIGFKLIQAWKNLIYILPSPFFVNFQNKCEMCFGFHFSPATMYIWMCHYIKLNREQESKGHSEFLLHVQKAAMVGKLYEEKYDQCFCISCASQVRSKQWVKLEEKFKKHPSSPTTCWFPYCCEVAAKVRSLDNLLAFSLTSLTHAM